MLKFISLLNGFEHHFQIINVIKAVNLPNGKRQVLVEYWNHQLAMRTKTWLFINQVVLDHAI